MFIPPGHIPLLDAVDAIASGSDPEAFEAEREELELRRKNRLGLLPPGPAMDLHNSFFALQASLANQRVIAARTEQAREAARTRLCQALGISTFSVIGIDTAGKIHTIQAEAWRTEAGFGALSYGRLEPFPPPDSTPQILTVYLPIAAFEKWRRLLDKQLTSIGAETRLADVLTAIMTATPGTPRSKENLKTDPQVSKFQVSGRAFERAWQAALERSGAAAWREPGRRKKITPG
jgi:hypothetical protein